MLVALLLAGTPVPAAPAPVPVLARPVERGEILSADDFVDEERPAGLAMGAVAPARAAGLEAVRRLAAGAIVRSGDVMPPRLVRRGEPVTLTVKSGALTITAQGRALADGRRGDVVRVVATATNRTLEGAVDGPGKIRIAAN